MKKAISYIHYSVNNGSGNKIAVELYLNDT